MHEIKTTLTLFDCFFGTLSGYFFIELLPVLNLTYLLSGVDAIVKTGLATAGLFYFLVRIYYSIKRGQRENAKALLEEERLKQELRENKIDLYQKFNENFKTNENTAARQRFD